METSYDLALSLLNAPVSDVSSALSWWSGAYALASALPVLAEQKPRFDGSLAADLIALRAEALAGRPGAAFEAAFCHGRPGLLDGPSGPQMGLVATDPAGAVLLPAAFALAQLLFTGKRVHRCARENCSTYFLDQTKNGSRRWCSLRCMERVRAPARRKTQM